MENKDLDKMRDLAGDLSRGLEKGGPGSGRHPEGNIGNPITVGNKKGIITGIKEGKDQFGQPTYHYVATMKEKLIPQGNRRYRTELLPKEHEIHINRFAVEKFEKGADKIITDAERLSASPPIKEKISEISESTPQITGVRNQKTNAIPGNKAKTKNAIQGSGEAGSKTPVA